MIAGGTNDNESSNEQNEHQTQGECSSLAQRAARTILVSCVLCSISYSENSSPNKLEGSIASTAENISREGASKICAYSRMMSWYLQGVLSAPSLVSAWYPLLAKSLSPVVLSAWFWNRLWDSGVPSSSTAKQSRCVHLWIGFGVTKLRCQSTALLRYRSWSRTSRKCNHWAEYWESLYWCSEESS